MAIVLVAFTIAAAILLIDVPRLIRNKLWGELITHVVLTFTAVVLAVLPAYYVEVPPLLTWLTTVVEPVGDEWLGWLQ